MTLRKTLLTGIALVAGLLVLLSGCDLSIYIFGPGIDPDAGLEINLSWNDWGSEDPHLYITYPAPGDGDTTDDDGAPLFPEPYQGFTGAGGDEGFWPSDHLAGVIPVEGVHERGAVYYADTQSSLDVGTNPAIEMTEIANDSETILVRGFPFQSSSTAVSTTGEALTGLPAGTYTWVGVMEVYVYATSGEIASEDGGSVNAVLTVTQNGEDKFTYTFPSDTLIKGSTVIRINCFYDENDFEVYQLNLDARQIQDTSQIRSVIPGDAPAADPVIIRVPRQ